MHGLVTMTRVMADQEKGDPMSGTVDWYYHRNG